MQLFLIKALDIGSYNENQIVDFYLSKQDLHSSKALKRWADENDESKNLFKAKKLSEFQARTLLSELIEEVSRKVSAIENLDQAIQELGSSR